MSHDATTKADARRTFDRWAGSYERDPFSRWIARLQREAVAALEPGVPEHAPEVHKAVEAHVTGLERSAEKIAHAHGDRVACAVADDDPPPWREHTRHFPDSRVGMWVVVQRGRTQHSGELAVVERELLAVALHELHSWLAGRPLASLCEHSRREVDSYRALGDLCSCAHGRPSPAAERSMRTFRPARSPSASTQDSVLRNSSSSADRASTISTRTALPSEPMSSSAVA